MWSPSVRCVQRSDLLAADWAIRFMCVAFSDYGLQALHEVLWTSGRLYVNGRRNTYLRWVWNRSRIGIALPACYTPGPSLLTPLKGQLEPQLGCLPLVGAPLSDRNTIMEFSSMWRLWSARTILPTDSSSFDTIAEIYFSSVSLLKCLITTKSLGQANTNLLIYRVAQIWCFFKSRGKNERLKNWNETHRPGCVEYN